MEVINFIMVFVVPLAVIILVIIKRSKYQNKSNAGAFFLEDNNLVLNMLIPYPIPFEDIEYVELNYSAWELKYKLSYNLSIKVVRKNGKTKLVFYKGYRTAKLALPSDMEKALTQNGIKCVMIEK